MKKEEEKICMRCLHKKELKKNFRQHKNEFDETCKECRTILAAMKESTEEQIGEEQKAFLEELKFFLFRHRRRYLLGKNC